MNEYTRLLAIIWLNGHKNNCHKIWNFESYNNGKLFVSYFVWSLKEMNLSLMVQKTTLNLHEALIQSKNCVFQWTELQKIVIRNCKWFWVQAPQTKNFICHRVKDFCNSKSHRNSIAAALETRISVQSARKSKVNDFKVTFSAELHKNADHQSKLISQKKIMIWFMCRL